jgi:hypothetical protein
MARHTTSGRTVRRVPPSSCRPLDRLKQKPVRTSSHEQQGKPAKSLMLAVGWLLPICGHAVAAWWSRPASSSHGPNACCHGGACRVKGFGYILPSTASKVVMHFEFTPGAIAPYCIVSLVWLRVRRGSSQARTEFTLPLKSPSQNHPCLTSRHSKQQQ